MTSRITPNSLHARAEFACKVLGLEPEEFWLQRSATGWHAYRRFGAGAQAVIECQTAAEMVAFLRGVSFGADPR
jgi:hypothetical protein